MLLHLLLVVAPMDPICNMEIPLLQGLLLMEVRMSVSLLVSDDGLHRVLAGSAFAVLQWCQRGPTLALPCVFTVWLCCLASQ